MAADPPCLPPRKKSPWPRRLGVFFFVVCPLLVVAGYITENWRGARAWERARARLAAEGETLDLASLWPPSVPREQNFCATPALDGIAEVVDGDEKLGEPARKRERLEALGFAPELPPHGSLRWSRQQPPSLKRGEIDWAAWRDFLKRTKVLQVPEDEPDPAKAVVAAFDPQRALLDEVAGAAATKPNAQFTPTIAEQSTRQPISCLHRPLISPIPRLTASVALRGRAAVAGAQHELARGAGQTLFRVRDASVAEGDLNGASLGLSTGRRAADLVFEGTSARLWTEEDYALWQEEFERVPWSPVFLRACRIELARLVLIIEQLTGDTSCPGDEQRGKQPLMEQFFLICRLAPRGWLRQNQATVVTRCLDRFVGPVRDGSLQSLMRRDPLLRSDIRSPREGFHLYSLMARTGLFLESTARQTAFAEIDRLQLLTACALERFFLKHQRYPETLSELHREFLPEIPLDLDGQPLRYARDETNGRYRLWSVGLNLTDDWHGHPPPSKPPTRGEPPPGSLHAPDWVLSFPAGQ